MPSKLPTCDIRLPFPIVDFIYEINGSQNIASHQHVLPSPLASNVQKHNQTSNIFKVMSITSLGPLSTNPFSLQSPPSILRSIWRLYLFPVNKPNQHFITVDQDPLDPTVHGDIEWITYATFNTFSDPMRIIIPRSIKVQVCPCN